MGESSSGDKGREGDRCCSSKKECSGASCSTPPKDSSCECSLLKKEYSEALKSASHYDYLAWIAIPIVLSGILIGFSQIASGADSTTFLFFVILSGIVSGFVSYVVYDFRRRRHYEVNRAEKILYKLRMQKGFDSREYDELFEQPSGGHQWPLFLLTIIVIWLAILSFWIVNSCVC